MASSLFAAVLVALVCCAGGASGATWVVTVGSAGHTTPCRTPRSCSLPGALYAAALGDTVEVKTDVVLGGRITLVKTGTGTLNIRGGGHTVSSNGFDSARAISFENWDVGQVAKISSLTFAGFSGEKHSVICQSADDTCSDTNMATTTPSAHQGGDPAPYSPTLILDDVTFYNNNCPEGAVGMWDLYQKGKAKLGLLINQCTFLDNTAINPKGSGLTYAGLLLSMSTNSRVVESLFQGNKFSTSLLGMPYFSSFDNSYSQVKAWDNTFVGSLDAGLEGKGYIMRAGLSNVSIYYSTFERNKGATLGMLAHNLTMVGSFARTVPPMGHGQLTADYLALGECSLTTDNGEPFPIVAQKSSFNRNPGALNLTFTYVTNGCHYVSHQGGVGCDPSQPCKNIVDSHSGVIIGYKCEPDQ